MSHFVVIVAGENVDEQLEPYFEQVESDSPYAEFQDQTEEVMEGWLKGTQDEWYPRFSEKIDEEKYNEIDGLRGEETAKITLNGFLSTIEQGNRIGLHSEDIRKEKIHVEVVRVKKDNPREAIVDVKKIKSPRKLPHQMIYPTLQNYVERYHGYQTRKDPETGEDQYGYYANPNAKWDWYQVGGRWAGFLKIKENAKETSLGEYSWSITAERKKEIENDNHASVAYKKDIDIEAMEKPLRISAEDTWDGWHEKGFGEKYKALPRDKNGRFVGNMPEDLKKFMDTSFGFLYSKQEIEKVDKMSREDYVRKESIWCPYAFLCDGEWYSRGDMGWFGMSANEDDKWPEQFKKMWGELPDDTLITVVDCHI